MSQTKVKSGLLNFPDQTDFVKLPSGTTAQRPSSPEKGYSRYNTTDNKLEFWNGIIWQQLPGVVAPIITSISYPGDDLAADPAGGQTITITGTDFKTGATVTVGGTTPSVITFVSATEITFTAPAKAAGDYDVVVTNTDGGNATAVDGMTYNGLPSWTTPAGNLGTFPAGSTIPTITLVATEPDSGVVSYSVTTGALPTGLTLTGADIDGTVPTPAGETTYNFSVTASDDENQESTERAFNIVVYLQVTNIVDNYDPFGGNGVALYQLNGDATDESGNYNGTASNVTYGTGVFGQAGVFNGSSSYISLGTVLNSNIYTYSFWVNPSTTTPSGLGELIGSASPDISYYQGTSGELVIYDGSQYRTSVNNMFVGGTWVHICIVANNTTLNVYKNGANVNTQTITGNNIASLVIGRHPRFSLEYFNGSIDQVRIFDTALTPLEVESLYRERTVVCGGQADTLDILGDNSCIAAYQFNGNTNDLSGNYSLTDYVGGATATYTVGEFDLALAMRSSIEQSNYIANLNMPNHNSESFWIKVNTFDDDDDVVFAYYIRRQGYTVPVVWTSAGGVFLDAADNLPLGVWTHVVLSIDGTTLSVYYDGQLQNTKTVSSGTLLSGVGIIADDALTTARFEADQVRIFNKALSAGEVTTLYNETACDALACGGTTNTLDILSDGSCIAAYPLDGSPLDLSGNHHGTIVGQLSFPPNGKFDQGISPTETSYITVPPSIYNGNSGTSISLWFKSNGVNYTTPFWAVGPSPTFEAGGWQIRTGLNGTGLTFTFSSPSSGDIIGVDVSTANLNNGEWHHVVASWDGTTNSGGATFYLNNALVKTSASSGNLSSYTFVNNNYIGVDKQSPGRACTGGVDQVRFFNKALSAGEVTTLYNETPCN